MKEELVPIPSCNKLSTDLLEVITSNIPLLQSLERTSTELKDYINSISKKKEVSTDSVCLLLFTIINDVGFLKKELMNQSETLNTIYDNLLNVCEGWQ